ncbi:hypothetical protein F2Q68_00024357 [Brassica cretica]|uniref:Replication factor A C-terminal domain-containing protein n=1 Tax=Brassica cretica TaxID=69181 RepID=A0A8S9IFL0_BRACR|nr:hypothetical protein F2Q68_00024357 [Brassica cretica]
MKLYLWDQAARDFCKKFKSYEGTPNVLLVTTVNTKTLGGTLASTSMSSSRVFMGYDVQPTIDYFSWLGSNPDIAEQVNAEVVTKRETMTIGEIFSYIGQESAKVNAEVVTKRETMTIGEIFSYIGQESAKDALFECTATIDDVVHGSSWYYIACSGCHSKVSKGPTSLLCTNKKCGKVNVSGVPQYLSKISVYDNSDQAVFVLLGDAGRELTGKPASELVKSYFEANGNEGVSHEAPVPKALISTIDTPPATVSSEGSKTTATSEETSENRVDLADGSKRTCYSSEMERAKSPNCLQSSPNDTANGNEVVNLEAPVPEALISTIGQKHKFCVKVTEHNFSGKTRALTVTKILPLDTSPATVSSEDNQATATSEETSENRVDSADGSKRTCDSSELERAKRPKCGN